MTDLTDAYGNPVSENGRVWQARLSKAGSKKYPMYAVNLPAALGRALAAENLFSVEIRLTDEGILLKPYAGDPPKQRRLEQVELPSSWDKA